MTEPVDGGAGRRDPSAPDELLDHRYDGIEEYDNPMPGWWVWMFWGSFVFSLGYLFHYWIGNGTGDVASYEEEMVVVREEAAKQALEQAVSEQSLALVAADVTSVKAGEAVYQGRCAACHGPAGEGLIGPNLTDSYWLHGKGTLLDAYGTVSEGVLAKGMPAWGRQLSAVELRQVVAAVGALRGKNVPGKAPQGEAVE